MVVDTSTSNSRSMKPVITFSSVCSFIWPCPTANLASGTSSASLATTLLMDETRLCTKNTWPSRSSSRRIAAAICFSS